MDLTCYRLDAYAVPIAPARPQRAIFDANRHAYKCLPLAIANTAGWELLCPTGVEIGWNGGPELADLHVAHDDPGNPFAKSNFSRGIVTFDTRWLFRTSPGDHLWAMGPTNDPKDGIAPLSGLIETDWIPYTFTMNWQMTRPGRVRFEKDEPFCFITPARIGDIADCRPIERPISDDADLQEELRAWTVQREAAMGKVGMRYFKGEDAPGEHFRKLRAKEIKPAPPKCQILEEGVKFPLVPVANKVAR